MAQQLQAHWQARKSFLQVSTVVQLVTIEWVPCLHTGL